MKPIFRLDYTEYKQRSHLLGCIQLEMKLVNKKSIRLSCLSKELKPLHVRVRIQGGFIGFKTGNGEKLSFSQSADLAWFSPFPVLILRSHPVQHSLLLGPSCIKRPI